MLLGNKGLLMFLSSDILDSLTLLRPWPKISMQPYRSKQVEKTIHFQSGNLNLVGLYREISDTHGAVITHPHPLYGGDMNNPVVESTTKVFWQQSISTLRFNFRGVGNSEGSFDNGQGEQKDVAAAIQFLIDSGVTTIYLAGYSFGSWALAQMKELPAEVQGMLFISPPIAMMPLAPSHKLPLLQFVVTGDEDEIAPPHLIEKEIGDWNPNALFQRIDFSDHFFFGYFQHLEAVLSTFIAKNWRLDP